MGNWYPVAVIPALETQRFARAQMQEMLVFRKLNSGWNAAPNAPQPNIEVDGSDIILHFFLNSVAFPQFCYGDIGRIRFKGCSKYRLGPTNDEGWYRGQCRYSGKAPSWGEFYEIAGQDPVACTPNDWIAIDKTALIRQHFLFYLRDETFEAFAAEWQFYYSSVRTKT